MCSEQLCRFLILLKRFHLLRSMLPTFLSDLRIWRLITDFPMTVRCSAYKNIANSVLLSVFKTSIRTKKKTERLLLLLFFFRLKSTCSLRLWCFTHHATSSFGTSIMGGFVYLLLAYLHATSLLIFYFFPCRRPAVHLPPSNKRLRNMKCQFD